ncbi:MAG: hypothetical protein COV99_11185 [Bacteroidetes bacterium CG12_big_fil_rev_8_21_14_0_65_60_17]|nr:MAG: hypothetical protein COV99_11185 [Bacteroidetes bacterium CG12_big_fil_rev_8_21_14_0_65_60_17]
MEDEFELEVSSLSRKITVDDASVDVQIYRGGGSGWILEVVDAHGTSTLWDDPFKTDTEALEEVERTIREEGIDALIGDQP